MRIFILSIFLIGLFAAPVMATEDAAVTDVEEAVTEDIADEVSAAEESVADDAVIDIEDVQTETATDEDMSDETVTDEDMPVEDPATEEDSGTTDNNAAPGEEDASAKPAHGENESHIATVKVDNPHIQIMNDKALELAQTLSMEEALTLGNIRQNFGIIRSIRVAHKSVGDAVSLCAEKNADLKDGMTDRYSAWDDAISKLLKKHEASLAASVNKQQFQNPEKIQDFLDSIDDAAEYADNHIEKTIITTPEACTNLMLSMDNTQEVIAGVMEELVWPHGKEAATGGSEGTETP